MIENQQINPLVSIAVVTYNSSKTIIETLDSISKQTYQNLELVISDDCSVDNTVELCKKWIGEYNGRFARVELLASSINTGIAGNLNRAEDACRGEWIKSIAGDDVLMPNCIQVCIDYVKNRNDVVYLFGKCRAFGGEKNQCRQVDEMFDYEFFTRSNEEQLHQLIYGNNCIPATTVFMHREKANILRVKNDERIPLLEDWPKWINLLKKGVELHFIDEVLVKYRVGGISSTMLSDKYYRSILLFTFYYLYPEWCKDNNVEYATNRMVEEIVSQREELSKHLDSKAYRLGKLLLKPFNKAKNWISSL